MKNGKQIKDQTIIFRATGPAVKSLDKLAKVIGSNRSEVLRRLIPDLTSHKEGKKCAK